MTRYRLLSVLVLCVAAPAESTAAEARLLRFPHIQGDKIAFVTGGDIWTASAEGGPAHRLTSFDEGIEIYPRISPDGKWVAFSGEYTGTRQIYVVPYDGGEPRQITFYPDVGNMPPRGGYDNLPFDWTNDGRILFKSNRTPYSERIARYFLVDPNGGLETPLTLPEGGPATLSPDGTKLACNLISREWRTWKRYRAGRAQDVHVYDLVDNTLERLTTFEGTDNHPMWLGERIYFTSDRTGTLNLYACDLDTKQIRPITEFEEFDVLWPSRGGDAVIFECGGYLYVMDAATEKVRKLTIELADDKPWHRPRWVTGGPNVESFDVGPTASRAAVIVRGDVFTVPKKDGEAVRVTDSPKRRERDVQWSPNGRWLSYLGEVGLEYELFLHDRETGEERQATHGTGSWILGHSWSPDSKRIVMVDRGQRLRTLDVETTSATDLDRGDEDMITNVSWSGDGAWIAYAKQAANGYSSIWISPSDRSAPIQVTTDQYNDADPAFDPGGKYVYFVSARDFDYGELDFDARIYALLLRPDVESPIAPKNDDEKIETDGDESKVDKDGDAKGDAGDAPEDGKEAATSDTKEVATDDAKEKEVAKAKPVEIDFDGISDRLVVLPLPPSSYRNLEGVEGGLLFVENRNLKRYDLEEREAKEVLPGVTSYVTTPDGKKLLYRHGGGLAIASASAGQSAGKDPLPLDRIRVKVDPRTEWAQMYLDAWRIMRDWFYDPHLHQVHWERMLAKYQPLVEHLSHRDDLDFVLGELIGELNCGHTYVQPGESPRVERVPVGVLGCELVADGDRYRIAKIYRGENWTEARRSPFTESGVDAKEGDVLVSIDGHDVTTRDNPYAFLVNTVGRHVEVELSRTGSPEDAHTVTIRPIASEVSLRYLDWVRRNTELVDRLSGGRIGYVHVPNTAGDGHEELYKGFQPQARVKEAMIIDDRYNGGGHIPWRMIRDIGMPVLNYWSRRHSNLDATPQYGFDGPMAMLINGYSSSGGDAFPYYFRKRGLGPLIGRKTWGGLVGYSFSPRLVDGGGLAVPAFSFVNTDGEWDVEYFGVAPDVEVFDDPTLVRQGRDPSIEAAVKHLLDELEAKPTPRRPPAPKGPKRDS